MSQLDRLRFLLSDCKPHSTFEIVEKVYDADMATIARVGARIYDLKRVYGFKIEGWHDRINRKLWWYQLIKPPAERSEQKPKRIDKPTLPSMSAGKAQGVLFKVDLDQHGMALNC